MAKVIYEKRDQIAYITLNRPEVHNAIDTETDELLFEAWTDFRDDPDVRIAILTGSGDKTFCAGADLKSHVDPWLNAGPELGRSLLEKGFAGRITRGLHRMPNRSSRRSTAGSSGAASNWPWPAISGSPPSTRTSGSSTCAGACISPTGASCGWSTRSGWALQWSWS